MNRRVRTEDLFGYEGEDERAARAIVAKIDAAPDPLGSFNGPDDIGFSSLEGSRIDGLLDRVTAVKGFSAVGQTYYSLTFEGRRASGLFPAEISEERVRSILSESFSEISIEVSDRGRLTVGEVAPTFDKSHNGGQS